MSIHGGSGQDLPRLCHKLRGLEESLGTRLLDKLALVSNIEDDLLGATRLGRESCSSLKSGLFSAQSLGPFAALKTIAVAGVGTFVFSRPLPASGWPPAVSTQAEMHVAADAPALHREAPRHDSDLHQVGRLIRWLRPPAAPGDLSKMPFDLARLRIFKKDLGAVRVPTPVQAGPPGCVPPRGFC